MDKIELETTIKAAFEKNCYTKIYYNSTERNVYPFSFRELTGGEALFAWCELHPGTDTESFYVSDISYAVIGDTLYYEPLFYSELRGIY
jgi:hypothetical protein